MSPAYDQAEVSDASAMMNAWYDKGYLPVYITARPFTLRELSRAWLEDHAFPLGPLVTAETGTTGDDTVEYKAAELAHEAEGLGWQTVAAYGNAATDIAAYEEAGIPKDATFIFGPEGGSEGTVAIPDEGYGTHIESYVSARPDANQPF